MAIEHRHEVEREDSPMNIVTKEDDKIVKLLPCLKKVRELGMGKWEACCPAHDDESPSLSISRGADGRALLYCHAGCTIESICRSLGINQSDLFADKVATAGRTKGRTIVARYKYKDEQGNVLYEVVRFDPKDFRQRRPAGKGRWTWDMHGVRRVLYCLPHLIATGKSEPVFVVEGENDVHALFDLRGDIAATCNPGGAGKWRDEYNEYFRGRKVVVVADKDDPGRRHAREVARSVRGVAASVKVIEMPGEGVKDADDWCEAGGTISGLYELAFQAPEYDPVNNDGADDKVYAINSNDGGGRASPVAVKDDEPIVDHGAPWPELMAAEAYHGLAGEIVQTIGPHTEADPAALLLQTLVAFGNAIGRNSCFYADGARHYANLFAVMVGDTSKGRKGTSWGRVHALLRDAAAAWAGERMADGLSSGEGLIWAVRDPVLKHEPVKERGRVVSYQDVEVDPGVSDKRLMVQEGEFGQCMKAMQREGNTLSPVIRNAWDGRTLRAMTKNSPATATDPHISIVGHITREELLRLLDATESANGFANRFLWVCVRRSKFLPEGGNLSPGDCTGLVARLDEAIKFGQEPREMVRDEEAKRLWAEVYPELSAGRPGMLGKVTSRAEAQVMRLAMIYALLDCSDVIRVEHLRAALAVWKYCEASARHVFGHSLGDRVADEILAALRVSSRGMTRNEIREYFGRNRSADEIKRALHTLLRHHLVRSVTEPARNGGRRPAQRWFAVSESNSPPTTITSGTESPPARPTVAVPTEATVVERGSSLWNESDSRSPGRSVYRNLGLPDAHRGERNAV